VLLLVCTLTIYIHATCKRHVEKGLALSHAWTVYDIQIGFVSLSDVSCVFGHILQLLFTGSPNFTKERYEPLLNSKKKLTNTAR